MPESHPDQSSSVSRNSRCMRSMTVARASSAAGLSALPYLTPRIAQFGSRCDFGVLCWTITATKSLQPGAVFLTASEIADSSSAGVIETRWSLLNHFFFGGGARACMFTPDASNFRAFSVAQKANTLIFFAAIIIALPSLSSLVASCKITKNSATKKLRIKIQANIVPSLRRAVGAIGSG